MPRLGLGSSLTGGPAIDDFENTGYLLFDGSDDYITIADCSELEFGEDDFSFSFWFYPTANARMAIIHGSFGADYSWGIDYYQQGTRNINFWASSNGTSWNMMHADSGGSGIGSASLTLGAWNHVVVLRTGDTIKSYLNKTLDLDESISGEIVNKANAKIIGAWYNGALFDLVGYMDEIAVYSKALSAAEVAKLYGSDGDPTNAGNPESISSLTGYWNCEEGSGSTVADGIGGNDATIVNAVTWGTH